MGKGQKVVATEQNSLVANAWDIRIGESYKELSRISGNFQLKR